MIRIQFTPADIEELNYQRYHHPHPQVQQKMEVLYLKSQGLAHQEIRRLCWISKTTLTTYLSQYLEGGIDRLQQLRYQGQPSALNCQVGGGDRAYAFNTSFSTMTDNPGTVRQPASLVKSKAQPVSIALAA
jgi:hypothetical protein